MNKDELDYLQRSKDWDRERQEFFDYSSKFDIWLSSDQIKPPVSMTVYKTIWNGVEQEMLWTGTQWETFGVRKYPASSEVKFQFSERQYLMREISKMNLGEFLVAIIKYVR